MALAITTFMPQLILLLSFLLLQKIILILLLIVFIFAIDHLGLMKFPIFFHTNNEIVVSATGEGHAHASSYV